MWSVAQTDLLTVLWAQGLSAAQISLRIPGTTRNAVIGKVHRLRFPPRPKKRREKPAYTHLGVSRVHKSRGMTKAEITSPPSRRPARLLPCSHAPVLAVSTPIPLVDTETHHCRWMLDETMCCGADTLRDSYWCMEHKRIVTAWK